MAHYQHPTADVQTADVGEQTKVWQYTVVLPGAKIGANCNICSHCFIESKVVIGDNVTIKAGVQLWDGVILEDDVFIGPNATFTNDVMPRSKHYPDTFPEICIQKGASIGANATLLPGITIGAYALVGAGSVVTKNIPPHELWRGNPAKFASFICTCGTKLKSLSHACHPVEVIQHVL